ncbi:MAG: DUF1080 domain-containing protein [Verrucomicrobiales bacterium]|nr:DUF1080 domain-containing protein [Verrucomicrobiales bacterium]
MKHLLAPAATVVALSLMVSAQELPEPGFVPIFDGKTLNGWHVSARTGHSRASQNKTGGRWVVEEGAIVGSQDIPGNGGLIITDGQYGDFEVKLEMKNDFGPDSGLFRVASARVQRRFLRLRGGMMTGGRGEGSDLAGRSVVGGDRSLRTLQGVLVVPG